MEKYLLIFDFDSTLSNQDLNINFEDSVHLFNTKFQDPLFFQHACFNEFDKMKRLFEDLIKTKMFKICVVSFGYKKMLDRFIKSSYGYDLINQQDIYGTDGLTEKAISSKCIYNPTYQGNYCKNHIIQHLIDQYSINPCCVFFFDDNESNINQFKEYLKDGHGNLVVPGRLLVRDVVQSLVQASLKDNILLTNLKKINNYDINIGFEMDNISMKGGGSSSKHNKYYKYKKKYLELKNSL
jgi:2-hydroxy-3-keto-5-methylthiopentenyl-1-phosphate phosphatase